MGFDPIPKEGIDVPEDGSPRSEIGNPQSATTTVRYFGDYELLEQVGRGGMGVVYKARQVSLHRLVALKMISAGELASPATVQRFKIEAEAAAKLDHSNIVPIYEIGVHQSQHYFSMKLVEGGSLQERIAREKGSRGESGNGIRQAAILLTKVARAVHYAHQHGVIHRDLKPGNILLDAQGEPHITDFGLAKILEHEIGVTRTAEVMGTPSYMSPEQAAGMANFVSTATDIWSLGVIFYELLTGRPPFRAENAHALLRKITEDEPVPPSKCEGSSPPVPRPPRRLLDMDVICLKCLEKNPARRYASAAALADDLEHWLRDEPIVARPAKLFERVVKWVHRQPVLAGAVVSIHIIVAAGLAGILWQWRHAVVARRAEAAERQRAVRAEAEAMAQLHQAKINYVRANRLSSWPGRRFDSLAAIAQTATPTNSLDLRNEAIACFLLPDARPLRQWAKTPRWPSFRFDASHRRYATNDASGNLTIRDTETDEVLAQIPVQGAKDVFSFAVFSPDDRLVATVDKVGQGRLWEELTQAPRLMDLPRGADFLAFAPDSRAMLVKHADDSVHFLSITNWGDKSFPGPPGLGRAGFQLNPSGEKFLTSTKWQVVIRRAVDGEHLRTLTPAVGATSGLRAVTWHPDGRRVAIAWDGNHIGLWDSETGRRLAEFGGHEGTVANLAFTPGGEYLVSGAWDTTTRFWDPDTGREVLRLPDAGNPLSISADARRLSFQSWDHRLVKLYELPDLTIGRRISLPPPTRHIDHYTEQAVFSPNGAVVAVSDREGTYIFDAAMGAPLALLPIPGMVCFSPDGDALFTGGVVGAQRWPLKWTADRSELHLGPPEVIEPTRSLPVTSLDLSRDGRSLVVQANHTTRGNYIVLTVRSAPPYEAVRFGEAVRLALSPRISPDGRWVATVPASFDQVQIWNGHTGRVVTNLSTQKGWQPVFSPDGRWLAGMERDSTTVWETSNWKVRRRITHPPGADVAKGLEFSPDGRILASFSSDWKVRLLRFDTGEELGEFPAGRGTHSVRFSSRGDRFAVANESGYFHLWNLRSVRAQLAALNLDWDLPQYAPEPPTFTKGPFRVIVHTNALASTMGEAKVTANSQKRVPSSAQVAELRKSIPAREANLPPELIDLSAHYNGSFLKMWGHSVGNNLAALNPGVHKFDGVDYDVRGLIQVRPSHNHGLPREVTGIPINRKCTRLNFLHLTGYVVKSGTKVGAYIIHFKSGQQIEQPILFGRDLDNWWFRLGEESTSAETVWTGSNVEAEKVGYRIRIFHSVWSNPWPDLEIESLDMISTVTDCNPTLIAITAD